MKTIKTATIGFLFLAMIILSSFAIATLPAGVTPISASLTYNDADLSDASTATGADSVPAFNLTTREESIELEDGTATDLLLFASQSRFAGIYFNGDAGIEEYDGDTFRLNGVEYTIERRASSYRISSTESGILAVGTQNSNTLVLPDNGRNFKILIASGEVPKALPGTIVFNSARGAEASAAGERAAGTASVSGDAPASAADGCVDADESVTSPNNVASYVTVTSSGSQSTVADYCAVSGDVTRLYEAVCNGNTARVEQVVCSETMICPEGEGACRVRAGEAANKFCIDSDLMTEFSADALTHSTTTRGTTIGYYAATTTDGGREFGAWADYCKDSKTLIEYYCTPGNEQRGAFREVICLKGCNLTNGKCENPPFCYDSDGGAYTSVKGIIRGVNASGQYFSKTDSCKDGNTVIEYRCSENTGRECKSDEQCTSGNCGDEKPTCNPARPSDPPAPYLSNGFVYEELSCGAGKYCNDGKCTSEAPLCNQCDTLNNFSIKQGTACEGTTPTAWVLKRCPAGQICSANACVPEPKATMAQVTTAFNNRKRWALLLNETLGWIETTKGITAPIVPDAYGSIMEEIAAGLSSTQLLMVRREIRLDVEANIDDGRFPGGFPP